MKNTAQFRKQQGAALVVGLILLMVVTVLAISGMNTATTELAMARNDQNYENAFQAAETGIEQALAQGTFSTVAAPVPLVVTITANESVSTQIVFEDSSPVPDKAFSLGAGSKIAAWHFVATAEAISARDPLNPTDRDSKATHTQAFYIVGPESPTL